MKDGAEVLSIEIGDKDGGVRKRRNPRLDCLGIVEKGMHLCLHARLTVRKESRFP